MNTLKLNWLVVIWKLKYNFMFIINKDYSEFNKLMNI